MTPQQLEDRQLETRVTALEAELSQVKKLLSSFAQTETVKHNWMQYAGVFKDDVDLETVVFNTEAHPLPVFQVGQELANKLTFL